MNWIETMMIYYHCFLIVQSTETKPIVSFGPFIGFELKYLQWDPKGGELYSVTAKSWETVMVAGVILLTCKLLVQTEHRGERLIEPPSSWFLLKFPSG